MGVFSDCAPACGGGGRKSHKSGSHKSRKSGSKKSHKSRKSCK